MTQPNELRIGNLIFGISDRVEIVCGVLEKTVKTRLPKVSKIFSSKYQDVTGIPITEEWLVKLGLEERYARGEWSWSKCTEGFLWGSYTEIRNTKNSKAIEGYVYHGDYPEIIYVHQLQNIYFSLTHQELKLKQ